MNLEKVVFAFFIVLSLTLNFGFFVGDLDNPNHHNVYELYAALVVSLIATIMKFGDRAHIGAVLLATSLVADLQLIAAVILWADAPRDLARVGIAAYGLWPSRETLISCRKEGGDLPDLRPVMGWKSRIAQVRTVEEGSYVGYWACTTDFTINIKGRIAA